MKLKQRDWILIGVLVIVVALVWRSGGFREMFSGVALLTGDFNKDQPLMDKINKLAASMGLKAGDLAIRVISDYGPMYTAATTIPTKDEFVSQVSKGRDTSYSQLTGDDKLVVDVAYQYFYGASTTPSPASSSSTQPMTVGIPSPCHPSYKSIPGGSMEFKCFN